MNKQCTKCKETYPATEEYFYRQRSKKVDGTYTYRLAAWCKPCSRESSKRNGNENKDRRSAYFKNWYQENKEKESERVKEWRDGNRQHISEYYRDYTQSEEFKRKSYFYGVDRGNKNHDINNSEWENCKTYFDHRCAYCNMPEELHKELTGGHQLHKEHVVYDGANDLSNCVPSCRSCNSQKWKHPMEFWYKKQAFYSEGNYIKIIKWIDEDHKPFVEVKKRKRKIR